ncbi:MAG: hypothetical protein Hals2KO_27160 [Halioglobus sp.]
MLLVSIRPHLIPTALVLACVLLTGCSEPLNDEQLQRSRQMPEGCEDAKLGIFIHWGPASVPAFAAGPPLAAGELEEVLLHGGARKELPYVEWYLYALEREGSDTALYHQRNYGDAPYDVFGQQFEQRVAQSWDADAWAQFFDNSGARYVVLVTKHHDGYTLWPSDVVNPYKSGWGSEQDLVGELARAVRARGMRYGTYYSTGLDWSFKLVSEGDLVRDVMRSAPGSQDYADYTFDHMRELIDRYQPDVLWADIGYPSRGRQGELLDYYYANVPEGVVNDRWGGVDVLGRIAEIPGAATAMTWVARMLVALESDPLRDDPARVGFKTAEYDSLPGIAPFKWETTRGLGGSFAFNAAETAEDMLSGAELVRFVADTVAKNGNVLINVGPDSHGRIPEIQQAPLLVLGRWLQVNGEAIYATQPWQRYRNLDGRELRYTRNDDALYAIVFGEAEAMLTIENPGVEWSALEVLGTTVNNVSRSADRLAISLDHALDGPAAVVKFTLR